MNRETQNEVALAKEKSGGTLSGSEGYKDTKLGAIPEDWKTETLGNLSIIKGDYGINAASVNYDPKLPTYLRITDISKDGKFIAENKKSVNDKDSEKFILSNDDIVFARTGATVGKTYRHKESNGSLVFAGFLIRFRINLKLANPSYIESFTKTNIYRNWVRVYSVRSGQPGLNSKEYCNLSIPLPSLPEQQKIAEILSTWDKAIAAQEKLIAEKQVLKKGLMQELLTGKKRFPGFEGEWEFKQLKDISEIVTGSTPKTKELDNYGGDFLFVSPADIGKSKMIKSSLKTVTEKGFNSGRKIPEKSVVFVCIGSTIGKVGISSCELITNQQINSIIPNEMMDNDFVYYQLLKEGARIKLMAGEQAVPMINKSNFSTVRLSYPKLKEQRQISKILSAVDNEIVYLKKENNMLAKQKRGLMQQLLTGDIRVKLN